MKNLPHSFQKTECSIGVSELQKFADGWLLSCEIAQHSNTTLTNRRNIVKKLLWFLRQREYDSCGVMELRQFFAYITNGHKEPGGRWGNPQETEPVKPVTVVAYHQHIRTLFRWIVAEGALPASPIERIPIPISRADQVQPFTPEQVNALIAAAKKGRNPRRDEALLLFLLDTGVRNSELCALTVGDVDMSAKRATVVGKGNKQRAIFFGKATGRALWAYLKDGREPDEPLFASERGEAFTRYGLTQLIERIGNAAKISHARCSPHTFRHTFAVTFLRNGGNQFSLMQMLGHTDLKMTARYVQLAQADVENQHRQFSPADALKKGGKR